MSLNFQKYMLKLASQLHISFSSYLRKNNKTLRTLELTERVKVRKFENPEL